MDRSPEVDQTTIHVNRAIEGSVEDLDWIIRRFQGLLMHQARRRLGEPTKGVIQAEDLVQETWVAVYRKLPELRWMLEEDRRVTPRLLTYLATTLRRLHRDHRVREIRRRNAADQLGVDDSSADPMAAIPEHTRGVLTRIGHAQAADEVFSAIAKLGETDRLVFIIRGIERTPLAVAGEKLGMKPDAVSRRYNRCLAKLRSMVPRSVFEDLSEDAVDSNA